MLDDGMRIGLAQDDAGFGKLQRPGVPRAVEQAVGQLRESEPKRSIDVTISPEPLAILSDEQRLLQSLSSLLEHVARHSPSDSTIRVTLEHRGDRAAIRIVAFRKIPFDRAPIESGKPPGALGGRSAIHDSSVSTSGALPRDATNAVGLDAGILSMMVRRVSAVVPWRA